MECKLMYMCLTGKPTCRDHIANAKNCFIPDPEVEQSPETPEAVVPLNDLLCAGWLVEHSDGKVYNFFKQEEHANMQLEVWHECGIKDINMVRLLHDVKHR